MRPSYVIPQPTLLVVESVVVEISGALFVDGGGPKFHRPCQSSFVSVWKAAKTDNRRKGEKI